MIPAHVHEVFDNLFTLFTSMFFIIMLIYTWIFVKPRRSFNWFLQTMKCKVVGKGNRRMLYRDGKPIMGLRNFLKKLAEKATLHGKTAGLWFISSVCCGEFAYNNRYELPIWILSIPLLVAFLHSIILFILGMEFKDKEVSLRKYFRLPN